MEKSGDQIRFNINNAKFSTISHIALNTLSLILASTSSARKSLLQSAGIPFQAHRPELDEDRLQAEWKHLAAIELAKQLALAKAMSVSSIFPDHFVLGADQTLEFESKVQHKPKSLEQAIENLRRMSGKQHKLHSAQSIVKNGQIQFSHVSTATLYMRTLSEGYLMEYAKSQQEALLYSLGGYHFESVGVQLFETAIGDSHTIMGLPLLPLLAFLRDRAIMPS